MKEAIIGFKILQVMLENCFGLIDFAIKDLLDLLNNELSYKSTKSYKSMIL